MNAVWWIKPLRVNSGVNKTLTGELPRPVSLGVDPQAFKQIPLPGKEVAKGGTISVLPKRRGRAEEVTALLQHAMNPGGFVHMQIPLTANDLDGKPSCLIQSNRL